MSTACGFDNCPVCTPADRELLTEIRDLLREIRDAQRDTPTYVINNPPPADYQTYRILQGADILCASD